MIKRALETNDLRFLKKVLRKVDANLAGIGQRQKLDKAPSAEDAIASHQTRELLARLHKRIFDEPLTP